MHSSADVELITGEADVELITGEVRALVRYVRETCTCAREELLMRNYFKKFKIANSESWDQVNTIPGPYENFTVS
jgi:hypothetical protein